MFQLIKEYPEPVVTDPDRHISFSKTDGSGPNYRVFTLKVSDHEYKVHITQQHKGAHTTWIVDKISYPKEFSGDPSIIQTIAFESLNAYRELFYEGNSQNIEISTEANPRLEG